MAHHCIARDHQSVACVPEGAPMSVIMIRCPNTDREISTGIEIDFVSFNRLPNVTSHSYCSICGHDHPWRQGEAWLASYATQARPSRSTVGSV
jgi:hypothetical protein